MRSIRTGANPGALLRTGAALIVLASLPLMAAGCASGLGTRTYDRGEVGIPARVEAATVLSVRPVRISGLLPTVGRVPRSERDRGEIGSGSRRGINVVVRIERTGETVSIVQVDDEFVQPGAAVWVEYGDRMRVTPRAN